MTATEDTPTPTSAPTPTPAGGTGQSMAAHGVTKSFTAQGPKVLDGVDLVVPAGSFTAILGASGSGKTTLLRLIAGFERLDHGTLQLGPDVVDEPSSHTYVPSEHRRVGYVPQEGALFPHLNVWRNVGFGLPRRTPDRKDRIDELLELVGLSGLHRRYPHQLSGGQQQRVALARALATNPELVLLDEPFSSLDASLRASVRAEVRAVLRQAGTTTILVTHDQDEALSMADQVAVLRHGVIAQLDTPAGLYGRPQDPALARFLGESNMLHADVSADGLGPDLAPLTADTPFGRLAVEAWVGPSSGGRAHVMIRPEQLLIGEAGNTGSGVSCTVESYEYFGHDAVVRVHPEAPDPSDLPDLVVRVTGGTPLTPGSHVRLSVSGPVVAWPVELPLHRLPDAHHHHRHHTDSKPPTTPA
ncbi:MAG TPA: ABC transporter ATP-binding protein [Acidimicrobiales bacterium]